MAHWFTKTNYMLRIVFVSFTLCGFLTYGCSLKSLTKSRKIKTWHRDILDANSCSEASSQDTFCLQAVNSIDIKNALNGNKKRLNVLYVVNSYCHGFYKTFLENRNAFDSISDLSMHVVFEEDFADISTLKSRLGVLKYYGKHKILDESEFGRYRDQRTKNRKIMELFAPDSAEIMISPFKRIPKDGPYNLEYSFLTATLYLVFDENLNFLSASWELSPDDVKRILNGEKPLQ